MNPYGFRGHLEDKKKLVSYLWVSIFSPFPCNPLSKFSQKGLLCFWNEDDFVLQNSISGNGYIGLEGTWLEGNRQVTIVNVYSPFDLEGKRALWLELKNLKALSSKTLGP